MGKRSTNTTKSGKYMNPTDQARKEARKRELKKNKKQRQLVRTAVLKGKNPREIIAELEKIDDMEFNVHAPPPLNEKVLRDKRRKLVETWNRVIHLYIREEPEQAMELKKLWTLYQNRKSEVMHHYDAVKNAQNVQVEEIPLPDLPPEGPSGKMDEIPLPPKPSILKKPSVLDSLKPKTCPGVPAGPPPPLSEYDDEESAEPERPRRIRFADNEPDVPAPGTEDAPTPKVDDLQKRMLQMSGQDVDAYMKEMEEVHRLKQAEKQADLQARLAKLEDGEPGPPGIPQPQAGRGMPPGPPPTRPPNPIAYRPAPPPLRPGMAPPGVRLPPGPPPGRPPVPPGPPPGRPPMQPPRMGPPGVRMPPGPPPGVPPRIVRPNMPRPLGSTGSQSVLSAGPQLIQKESTSTNIGGVIEAKPQMRNLRSDVTRFVPTTLKVRRDKGDISGVPGQKKKQSDPMMDVFARHAAQQPPQQQGTKDDAYAQFMMEMDSLLSKK